MKFSTWIIAAIIAAVLIIVTPGCDGSGGMGGQGIVINIHQNGPGALEAVATGPDGQKATGGNASVVNVNVKDGGTTLGNPLPESSEDSGTESPPPSGTDD